MSVSKIGKLDASSRRILTHRRHNCAEGSKKKGLEAIGQTIEGTLRTIESKTFAASPAMLDKIPSILLQMREQMEGTDTTARDKGINLGELDGILRKAYGSEPYAKQPSVARLFNVLDTDEDGLLTPLQVSCSLHILSREA